MRSRVGIVSALFASMTLVGAPGAAAELEVHAPTDLVPTSCSISLPERVAVTGPTTVLSASLGGDCPHGALAAWAVTAPDGTKRGTLAFRRTRSAQLTVPTHKAGSLGAYTLRPVYAVTSEYQQLLQGSSTTTLKAGSKLTSQPEAAARGPLAVTATYYDVRRSQFRVWPGATINVQRGTCAPLCTWKTVRTVQADADGRAVVAAPAVGATWRTTVEGTASVWQRATPPRTR